MIATGSLVAWPFFPPALAIGGTLAATIVELLPLPVDDNLSIPLAAGLTLTLLRPLAL
jgi:dolichol kinase